MAILNVVARQAVQQLNRLVELGYADVADLSHAEFRALAQPLIALLNTDQYENLGENILLAFYLKKAVNLLKGLFISSAIRIQELSTSTVNQTLRVN